MGEQPQVRRGACCCACSKTPCVRPATPLGRSAGTGPLEQDEQLAAAAWDALPRNQRHALLYRAGQKRLARAYLAHAKKLLQQEMAHLALLQRE